MEDPNPAPADDMQLAGGTAARGQATRRVITLRAGEYWRAMKPLLARRQADWRLPSELVVNDGSEERTVVPAGMVLLIASIKRVEGEIHSVELAGHPAAHPGSSFRMLVDQFTEDFEHLDLEEAKRIRDREVAEIQGELRALETKIRGAQSTPEAVRAMIDEGLMLLPPDPTTRALALPMETIVGGEMSVGDALALRPQDWEAHREAVAAQSREARAVTAWMKKHQDEIGSTLRKLTPFYAELSAAAEAVMEDQMAVSARLEKGLANLDLYTGKDVEVETLRTGAPAPVDCPLTITQSRLFVDEELAVWKDVSATFDFEKLPEFDEVLGDERLLDQLFSAKRGVVLMSVRRERLEYRDSDVWTAYHRNKENTSSWLLVRNGANVHRVRSSVSSHAHARMLFPTLDDMQGVFRGLDGSKITLESIAYPDRREEFDSVALHYRRFLLLLCGLDHRLSLFGAFYPEGLRETSAFLSVEFQQTYFGFIADAEPHTLLPDGRPSLRDWINSHNERLQSGSRVLVRWLDVIDSDVAPAMFERDSYKKDKLARIMEPNRQAEVVVAFRDAGELCGTCEANGTYSYGHATRPGKRRELSARVVLKDDRDRGHAFCGWLCLDAVDPGDLRHYIGSRAARERHASYLRLFKAGAEWLEAELERERPTRESLVDALLAGNVVSDRQEAGRIVGEAVISWRAARRGAALPVVEPGAPEPEGWQSLYAQLWTIARRGENQALIDAGARLAAESGRQPLRLVSTGESGALAIYAAPADHERDDRLGRDGEAVRTRLRRVAGGGIEADRAGERRVQMLKNPAKEILLHRWPGHDDWTFEVPPKLRRSAKIEACARCEQFEEDFAATWTPAADAGEWRGRFEAMKEAYEEGRSHFVSIPEVVTPFGAMLGPEDATQPVLLCLGASAKSWLMLTAPSEAEKDECVSWIVRRYQNEEAGAQHHPRGNADIGSWGIYTFFGGTLREAPWSLTGRPSAHRVSHPGSHHWKVSEEVAALDEEPVEVEWAEILRAYRAQHDHRRGEGSRSWVLPAIEQHGAEFFRRVLEGAGLLDVLNEGRAARPKRAAAPKP